MCRKHTKNYFPDCAVCLFFFLYFPTKIRYDKKKVKEVAVTERKKRRRSAPQVVMSCLMVFFAAVFLICGGYLLYELLWRTEAQQEYQELSDLRQQALATMPSQQPTPPSDPIDPTAPSQPPEILPELQALYELNNELVGWIQFPGTTIDHPVMQSPDNPDFYLTHTFDKSAKKCGAIYVREQCDVYAPSDNVVIYGHYQKGGGMFYPLKNYTKKSYWKEHQTFTFDTLYERHTYQIIAVFKTQAYPAGYPFHWFNNAINQAEFDEYIQTVKEMALYDTGISAEYGDKLVSLCTCEYSQKKGRLVIVAKQIS